jgi:hypothetical protein
MHTSLMPTMVTPTNANPMPIKTGRPTCSRMVIGAKIATHNGAVLTKTTELATLVYSKDVIQVAK